jgi:hypothetical protein
MDGDADASDCRSEIGKSLGPDESIFGHGSRVSGGGVME